MNDLIGCPMCDGNLEYKESSFEQCEPSTYKCTACKVELTPDFVQGYITGLKDERGK